jgi:hypothetical protein
MIKAVTGPSSGRSGCAAACGEEAESLERPRGKLNLRALRSRTLGSGLVRKALRPSRFLHRLRDDKNVAYSLGGAVPFPIIDLASIS